MNCKKIFNIKMDDCQYTMYHIGQFYHFVTTDFKRGTTDMNRIAFKDDVKLWINTIMHRHNLASFKDRKTTNRWDYLINAKTKVLFNKIMANTSKGKMQLNQDYISFKHISGNTIEVYEDNGNYEPAQIDGFQINKGKYFIMTYDGGTGYYDHQVSKDEYYRVKKIYDNQHKRGTK